MSEVKKSRSTKQKKSLRSSRAIFTEEEGRERRPPSPSRKASRANNSKKSRMPKGVVSSHRGLTEDEQVALLEERDTIIRRYRRKGMTDEQIEEMAARRLANGLKNALLRLRAQRALQRQMALDRDQLRDFWAALSGPGIPFMKQRRRGGRPVKRVMWINEEMWRLLIGSSRSHHRTDLSGLFLLDISGIWTGLRSPTFKKLPPGTRDPDLCMSLIGSERTIDMIFNSTQERAGYYAKFKLLLRMVHDKAMEKKISQYKNLSQMKKQTASGIANIKNAIAVKRKLQAPNGIRVTYIMSNARKAQRNLKLIGSSLVPAKLSLGEIAEYEAENDVNRSSVYKTGRALGRKMTAQEIRDPSGAEVAMVPRTQSWTFGGMFKRLKNHAFDEEDEENEDGVPYGIDVKSLIDCRPGMYSTVFADLISAVKQNIKFFNGDRKQLSELERHTVTLVGADRTFSLQFPRQKLRDEFVVEMKSFIELINLEDKALIDGLIRREMVEEKE